MFRCLHPCFRSSLLFISALGATSSPESSSSTSSSYPGSSVASSWFWCPCFLRHQKNGIFWVLYQQLLQVKKSFLGDRGGWRLKASYIYNPEWDGAGSNLDRAKKTWYQLNLLEPDSCKLGPGRMSQKEKACLYMRWSRGCITSLTLSVRILNLSVYPGLSSHELGVYIEDSKTSSINQVYTSRESAKVEIRCQALIKQKTTTV